MKKSIMIFLSVVLTALLLVGCGKTKSKQPSKRILYNTDLSQYVKLGDYKNLTVDTASEEWKNAYDSELSADVEKNGFYVRKTEGKVADGDTVNIDYVGKKDGVAFEGGTAQGYDLVIGSGSFIDGFESGLIGKEIGSTVDLNLTFPENYQSADLAGKAVVFTVTINYVTSTDPMKPEEYFKELGFDSVKDYDQEVKDRATKALLTKLAADNAEIKDYPEEDIETIYTAYNNLMTQNLQNQYGIDFETYLGYINQSADEFKADTVSNEIKPNMKLLIEEKDGKLYRESF
ncbi:MAG: FKBP-type peptidyl-prolyl cis-trans isomerase, partial [Clostridia bacterium]|nr:FKBP-type peptidyl-prolyl cis-trans isomerase [Clostridia bacterium]